MNWLVPSAAQVVMMCKSIKRTLSGHYTLYSLIYAGRMTEGQVAYYQSGYGLSFFRLFLHQTNKYTRLDILFYPDVSPGENYLRILLLCSLSEHIAQGKESFSSWYRKGWRWIKSMRFDSRIHKLNYGVLIDLLLAIWMATGNILLNSNSNSRSEIKL